MAKKARTPAPPRKVQVPQRRVEHRQRPDFAKSFWEGNTRYWIIGGLAAVLVVGGIIGGVVATRSSHRGQPALATAAPITAAQWKQMPGIQTGKPPWKPQGTTLLARLNVLSIASAPTEQLAFHIHQHLDIYVDGKKMTVPFQIGWVFKGKNATELAVIHNHDTSGIIHVESASQTDFTLGDFFAEWGVKLTKNCIGGLCATSAKPLHFYVNGYPFTGDPTRIVLRPHDVYAITYGKAPPSIPQSYSFPAGL